MDEPVTLLATRLPMAAIVQFHADEGPYGLQIAQDSIHVLLGDAVPESDGTLKDRHRSDLMQALAYSTLFAAPKIVTLLVYPCGVDAYRRLHERRRAHAVARIRTTPRNLFVGLMAVPLGGDVRVPVAELEGVVRGVG